MRQKLRTEAGRSISKNKMRKVIVEPVFGPITEWRGFRRFSFRGVGNVRLTWQLICLAGNRLKLHRWEMSSQTASKGAKLTFRPSVAYIGRF